MKKAIRVNEYMDLQEEHRLSEQAYRSGEEISRACQRDKSCSEHPVLDIVLEFVGEVIFGLLESFLDSL